MKKVLGIDIGGTKISYAIIDEKGNFLSQIEKKSTPKNIDELKNLFQSIIKSKENDVDIISFATAGAVNISNTRVESSTPNMPEGYNKIDFTELSDKPVYVENDANCAAWAEYKIGAAKGDDNTIIITLGTGVGGGIIIEGKLLRGKSGRAGEIGSMKINSGRGRICTCHRKDCYESYASGSGLKMTAEEIARTSSLFKSSIYNSKSIRDITTYDIIAGLKQNDLYSKEVFDTWQNDIIIGLIGLTNIFDPDSIVISGGMGEFTDIKKIENDINSEIVVSPVKVKLAKTSNNAGMIGSALLAVAKY